MSDKIFCKGLMDNKPFEDSSKLNLSVYIPEFDYFSKKYVNERGYLELTLAQGKDSGKWYAEVRQDKIKPVVNDFNQLNNIGLFDNNK